MIFYLYYQIITSLIKVDKQTYYVKFMFIQYTDRYDLSML